ncbi:MAG: PDZ domain-containing protein [Candidatus Kapaibacterium sp.]
MTIRRLILSSIFLSLLASSGFARRLMQFTVDLRDTKSHKVHITLVPSGFKGGNAVYQMPIWAPGAYSVTGYGRFVTNFKAADGNGYELPTKQLNENRWQIESGTSVQEIDYDVLDSHSDTTSLYFAMANMDTSLFFANATCLFGYYDDDKTASAQVEYQKPSDWKLACALPPSKKGYVQDTNATFQNTTFYAKDYDALADAPIIAAPGLVTKSFKEGTAIYDVVLESNGAFSTAKMDSLTEYLRKIVHAETDFFHETPYDHYTFEIVAPTLMHMPSYAQGALEHSNSSDYLLANFGWSMFKSAYLSIFSHEFFHLWNVKRVHSSLLGPFDYTKRVMTTSLWMAEGITEYYAHTLLARYGIIGPGKFYVDVEQWRREMEMAREAAARKSLEELSIDESTFDLDEATLFYSKGPIVALMLDIEIRKKTQNKKSLDDVMLALNNDAKHGKTFHEDQLIHLVEKYSGVDLTDFYNRYIKGYDSLPFDSYLAMMGLHPEGETDPDRFPKPKLTYSTMKDGSVIFDYIDESEPLARAGIQTGDILSDINGTKITRDNMDDVSRLLSPAETNTTVTVSILRGGTSLHIPVHIPFAPPKPPSIPSNRIGPFEVDPNAPPLATEIRKGIVGQ